MQRALIATLCLSSTMIKCTYAIESASDGLADATVHLSDTTIRLTDTAIRLAETVVVFRSNATVRLWDTAGLLSLRGLRLKDWHPAETLLKLEHRFGDLLAKDDECSVMHRLSIFVVRSDFLLVSARRNSFSIMGAGDRFEERRTKNAVVASSPNLARRIRLILAALARPCAGRRGLESRRRLWLVSLPSLVYISAAIWTLIRRGTGSGGVGRYLNVEEDLVSMHLSLDFSSHFFNFVVEDMLVYSSSR